MSLHLSLLLGLIVSEPVAVAQGGPDESQIVMMVENLGGRIRRDGKTDTNAVIGIDLGESRLDDSKLGQLRIFTALRSLNIGATEITDQGLSHLEAFKNLEQLTVSGNEITDQGLSHLAVLKNLQELTVGGMKISDAGLEHIAGLRRLRKLDIRLTHISDAGLKQLAHLADLEYLNLNLTDKHVLDPSQGSEHPEAEKNEGLVLKARGLLARKDYEPARAILEELGAGNPRWVYPRVILSHVLLQEDKDPVSAERVLREIVDLDPGQAESWRNLAVLLRHQGKLAQAAGVCRSARAHCPQDVDLLLLHGIVLRENGDFPEAEGCLLAVVSGQWPVPTKKAQECRIEARHQLAFLYMGNGRHLEAESQWLEVLAECPEHPAARQGLDTLQRQRNGKQEALAAVS